MKKVFSKEKYLKDNVEPEWINECDGLTEEEMNKLGYSTHPDWMVEVEEDE